jgi:hypothetical protein
MAALAALLPAAAPGGNPAADWSALAASTACFFVLWLANQALWRKLRWHQGNRGDVLCVRRGGVRGGRRARRPGAVAASAAHARSPPHACVCSGNTVSCGMSLFHGVSTAVLSGREARRARPADTCWNRVLTRSTAAASQVYAHWSSPLDGPNTAQQNFIMQLSMARGLAAAAQAALGSL